MCGVERRTVKANWLTALEAQMEARKAGRIVRSMLYAVLVADDCGTGRGSKVAAGERWLKSATDRNITCVSPALITWQVNKTGNDGLDRSGTCSDLYL